MAKQANRRRNRGNTPARGATLISRLRPFAQMLLADAQKWKTPPPPNYSGLMLPRVGDQLLLIQYHEGKLVGLVTLPISSVGDFVQQVGQSVAGLDWATIYGIQATAAEAAGADAEPADPEVETPE